MPLSSDEQVKAGTHRQIFDIEQPAQSRNPSGSISNPPWTLYATVRGMITTINGREVFAGDEFMMQATHTVELRYYSGITNLMRVNFRTEAQRATMTDGRLFDILLVNDINERHRKIELTCMERKRSHGI